MSVATIAIDKNLLGLKSALRRILLSFDGKTTITAFPQARISRWRQKHPSPAAAVIARSGRLTTSLDPAIRLRTSLERLLLQIVERFKFLNAGLRTRRTPRVTGEGYDC